MAYQPVAATALVELVYQVGTTIQENTLYFRHAATSWTPVELTTLGNEMAAWWEASIAPLASIDVSLVRVDVTDLSEQFGSKVVIPLDPAVPGEASTDRLPSNVSMAVTFTTGKRGRAFRGRNFVVGLVEGQVNDDQVNGSAVSLYLAAYNALLVGGSSQPTDATWVVVSRVVNQVVQMPTALTNPVLAAVVADDIVDSQRRRLPGRGR